MFAKATETEFKSSLGQLSAPSGGLLSYPPSHPALAKRLEA